MLNQFLRQALRLNKVRGRPLQQGQPSFTRSNYFICNIPPPKKKLFLFSHCTPQLLKDPPLKYVLPLTVFLFSWRKSTKVSVNIFSVLQRLCSKQFYLFTLFNNWTFRTACIYHVIIKHLDKIIWLETIRT